MNIEPIEFEVPIAVYTNTFIVCLVFVLCWMHYPYDCTSCASSDLNVDGMTKTTYDYPPLYVLINDQCYSIPSTQT